MAVPLVPCPLCAVPIPANSFFCRHCKQNLPKDASGKPKFNLSGGEQDMTKGDWFCAQCGTVGTPKKVVKGSFMMEVFLWLLFIVPGILYSLWRLTSKHKACPRCDAPNMIPVTSPVAQAALKQRA